MAVVRNLERVPLNGNSPHSEVECTYSIVFDEAGHKCLQLDTYGSKTRKIPGKKSQSLRLAPEAIAQLKTIFEQEF